jgi:hypothetical protein
MERIAPMTSATAETPTWMVCLGFAIPLRVVGQTEVLLSNSPNKTEKYWWN